MPTDEKPGPELFLDVVLAAMRNRDALPHPRLIVMLRRFNGEFARICTERGLAFDDNGVVTTMAPPQGCA